MAPPAESALPGSAPGAEEGDAEQRLVMYGVPWRDYCVLRELLDSPGLRMTYIEGTLELMTPSPLHERLKTTIARLVETFALERDVPLYGYGSTTFRSEAKERGLEPDECYVMGGELRESPDIALEVVVKSGGIDKLAVYAGLGVGEVWFFEDGSFHLYALAGQTYRAIDRSELVPELDFAELAALAMRPDQHEAVREYSRRLRKS